LFDAAAHSLLGVVSIFDYNATVRVVKGREGRSCHSRSGDIHASQARKGFQILQVLVSHGRTRIVRSEGVLDRHPALRGIPAFLPPPPLECTEREVYENITRSGEHGY
jgi:hypothetical protein